jgi:hypothetical protein
MSQLSGDLLDHELPSVERDRVTGEPTFARFASSGCAGWALTTAITLFVSMAYAFGEQLQQLYRAAKRRGAFPVYRGTFQAAADNSSNRHS